MARENQNNQGRGHSGCGGNRGGNAARSGGRYNHRGGGRGNQGGYNRNRNYNRNSNNNFKSNTKGECKELGNNVYFISNPRQADNYIKVTESILRYIQKTYTDGSMVKDSLDKEESMI